MKGDIHFVFLGKELPSYALPALSLVGKTNRLRVNLICNEVVRKKVEHVCDSVIIVESFYDNSKFESAKENLLSDYAFRDGFWIKSYERLFIIEQAMSKLELDYIFHAELDQLLFNTHTLLENLRRTKTKSLFVPYHNEKFVVPSLLFCNHHDSLLSLINFANRAFGLSNEMQLLSEWSRSANPSITWLPTLATTIKQNDLKDNVKARLMPLSELGGIVDAAQIGQWLAGIDPRNVPISKRPQIGFHEITETPLLNVNELRKIRFEFVNESSELRIRFGSSEWITLYNLHLHSKVHPWIAKSVINLSNLLAEANQQSNFSIPGTRKFQIEQFMKSSIRQAIRNPEKIFSISRRIFYRAFRIQPSSFPFITKNQLINEVALRCEKSISHSESKNNHMKTVLWEHNDVRDLHEYVKTLSPSSLTNIIAPNLIVNNGIKEESSSTSSTVRVFSFVSHLYHSHAYIPIGMESFQRGNFSKRTLRNARGNIHSRKDRCFWIQPFEIESESSKNFVKTLRATPKALLLTHPTALRRREMFLSNKFFIPFQENGQDLTWIWESMYLKCIPVLVKNRISLQLSDLGLPVLLIETFQDLINFDENFLQVTYSDNFHKFNSESLFIQFWLDKIFSS